MTSADLAAALLDCGHQGDVATAVRLITETEPTARELQLTGVQRRIAAIAQRVGTAGTAL